MEDDNFDEMINKLSEEFKKPNIIINNIDKIDKKINIIDKEVASINKSIELEIALKYFPSQALGSILFYNQLNEKYELFDDKIKFNKIIRFLEHIENKEDLYRDLYVSCTKSYYINPYNVPFHELSKEKSEIEKCYNLLSILIKEVNVDQVNFNKVYNNLEDAGLFMTVPEKINQQYLSEISLKLDNVISELKYLFESFEETNRSLGVIEESTSEISFNTHYISNQLWDISSNLGI